MEGEYELLLADGTVVRWAGPSGPLAAARYVDAHREDTVVAWRWVRHGLFFYGRGVRLVEGAHASR